MEGIDSQLRGQAEQVEEVLQLVKDVYNETENNLNQLKSEHLVSSLMVKTEMENIDQSLSRMSELLQEGRGGAPAPSSNAGLKEQLHKEVKAEFEGRFE
jgi:hypothetical protein